MTPYDAILNTIFALNKKAKEYHERKNFSEDKSVFYGRSPSLSNYMEEVLALNLSKVYPNNKLFVDYPVRLYDNKETPLGSQNIYPDIMITDNEYNLKALIELKGDLGHLDIDYFKNSVREEKITDASFGIINSIVGRYTKEDHNIKKLKINFKNFKKIMIVVSLLNQHRYNGINKSIIFREELLKKNYTPLFLLDSVHYNSYDDISDIIKEELKEKKNSINDAFLNI